MYKQKLYKMDISLQNKSGISKTYKNVRIFGLGTKFGFSKFSGKISK